MAFLWNPWNILTRMRRRKWHFLYIGDRADLIVTSTKLLDTKYTFYGFNDDLIETCNHCHTAGFSKNKTSPCCYVELYILTVVVFFEVLNARTLILLSLAATHYHESWCSYITYKSLYLHRIKYLCMYVWYSSFLGWHSRALNMRVFFNFCRVTCVWDACDTQWASRVQYFVHCMRVIFVCCTSVVKLHASQTLCAAHESL